MINECELEKKKKKKKHFFSHEFNFKNLILKDSRLEGSKKKKREHAMERNGRLYRIDRKKTKKKRD